ncbi:hypothetical protein ABT340_21790 [Streptosporangium sp. NPDC000239]|uniref:hypothetical protein n=1 Tax=Streptosporangium sp. NPDC000239 TaxID=3154248 RepID=UPI003327357E
MDSLQIAVFSLVVLALVVYRQMRTRPAAGRGLLVFGLILTGAGVYGGGLLEESPSVLGVAVIAVEAVMAVAFGALRAWTVRVWREADGVAWARGTAWTLAAWVVSFAARLALFAAGGALGLTYRPAAALVFAGLTVAAQAVLVARRGRMLGEAVPAWVPASQPAGRDR